MISFLKGVIEEIGENYLAIDVNGVGYHAFASSRTLSHLAEGEVTQIYTHTYVRESELTLFGFLTSSERQIFEVLISVSGVGPKVGLAIMSALNSDEIVNAVANQDGKTFARANGVGPKLGDRIVLELKDKFGKIVVDGAQVIAGPVTGIGSDVLSALMNLGYKPNNAQRAVSQVMETIGDNDNFDAVFKASLAELR